MANEYDDQDLYGNYGYENDGETPASLSALIASFRNLTVNSAMIENLAVQNQHVQSIAASKIEAGEILVDSNNLAFNATWGKDTAGWTLGTNVTRDTSVNFMGYPSLKSAQSGLAANAWRGAQTHADYRMPCAPGEKWTASVFYMTPNHANFDADVTVEVAYYDASGAKIGALGKSVRPDASNVWKRINFTREAPANAVTVGVQFYIVKNGTAHFAAPQLQRGDFLTPFTPNGTYIGPNGVMTTDIVFSGTLSGANGTFNGKLENINGTKKVVIENGGITTLNPNGNLNMEYGAYGINYNPTTSSYDAVFGTSGMYNNVNGHQFSIGANIESANDALELYSSKGRIRAKNRVEIPVNGDASRLIGTDHTYQTFYVGSTRYGYVGKAAAISGSMYVVAEQGAVNVRGKSALYLYADDNNTILFNDDNVVRGKGNSAKCVYSSAGILSVRVTGQVFSSGGSAIVVATPEYASGSVSMIKVGTVYTEWVDRAAGTFDIKIYVSPGQSFVSSDYLWVNYMSVPTQ